MTNLAIGRKVLSSTLPELTGSAGKYFAAIEKRCADSFEKTIKSTKGSLNLYDIAMRKLAQFGKSIKHKMITVKGPLPPIPQPPKIK